MDTIIKNIQVLLQAHIKQALIEKVQKDTMKIAGIIQGKKDIIILKVDMEENTEIIHIQGQNQGQLIEDITHTQ